MPQLQIACLLRPGTQERWRRLYQELAGPRREQWEALSQQTGITQVQVRLVQLYQSGEIMLLTFEIQDSQHILKVLATSRRPFDCWLQTQLRSLLGWNMQEVLINMPEDLIFVWPAEEKSGKGEVLHADDISFS
ncbi:hypothetical protein [Ktedonobacter robiniae]|uniref:Uncharacterized protein n=1 Tax=Ktedonobacter robiniae TaxID=2778365 RepID=A0ABQ3V7L1_9CHLR|nr:hypothetical protein [Ktedonobacter robiniae]GHO60522.1 hypothetical protein KSB_89970 [Ktedonobacter robiniae]